LSPQRQLIQSRVFRFLLLDVLADHRLVSTDGRDEVVPCPEMLAGNVPLLLGIHPRRVDGALPLDEPDAFTKKAENHAHAVAFHFM
jgi:hypothetical protein